jgi:aminomethyltransferase
MTGIRGIHEDHGATVVERNGTSVVGNYGRPAREHGAVRNGVGVIEMAYDVLSVTGEDRIDYVDNAVSNRIPTTEGEGCYALLLDPQGGIETELHAYHAGERLLLFVPPGAGRPLAEDWREKIFIEDVEIDGATDDFAVFGVHGPQATEKIASVLNGAGAPEECLTFVRGSMADAGVTIARTDAPAGEESYEVICAEDDAESVLETLLTRGMNAAPFGYDAWDSLTLEAGTPLFDTELQGEIPNVAGIRFALDFEKGCYVGQEVVSRVENRGQPSRKLVGLLPESRPESGAAVLDGDESVGSVTRAVESPQLEQPIALAYVSSTTLEAGADRDELAVRIDGTDRPAPLSTLPFVDGSERSRRLPTYGQ